MATCRWCEQPFQETKPWQEFCCTRHQQDWHLHQRKLKRQEKLFDRLVEKEQVNGSTEKERKQAKGFLDQMMGAEKEVRRFVRRI